MPDCRACAGDCARCAIGGLPADLAQALGAAMGAGLGVVAGGLAGGVAAPALAVVGGSLAHALGERIERYYARDIHRPELAVIGPEQEVIDVRTMIDGERLSQGIGSIGARIGMRPPARAPAGASLALATYDPTLNAAPNEDRTLWDPTGTVFDPTTGAPPEEDVAHPTLAGGGATDVSGAEGYQAPGGSWLWIFAGAGALALAGTGAFVAWDLYAHPTRRNPGRRRRRRRM